MSVWYSIQKDAEVFFFLERQQAHFLLLMI